MLKKKLFYKKYIQNNSYGESYRPISLLPSVSKLFEKLPMAKVNSVLNNVGGSDLEPNKIKTNLNLPSLKKVASLKKDKLSSGKDRSNFAMHPTPI